MKKNHIITAGLALAAIVIGTAIAMFAGNTGGNSSTAPAPFGPVPSEKQIQWGDLEMYAFIHFGLNTYTNQEWGYGDEDPGIFNPSQFDPDKIVSTFKKAGMKGLIYTTKHHNGFCLWPTKTTEYNISKSPWKNGQGDVVREFADACKKHGLLFGVYLSPWDRNCAEYGKPGYLEIYHKQIEELLTNYGDIFEMWFDGANGGDGYYGGAKENRKIEKTYYNWGQIANLIRSIQPNCIIWGASGLGDVDWGGSEQGFVKYPNWNVAHSSESSLIDRLAKTCWPFIRSLVDTPTGEEVWMPVEADVSIMKGWFWHPGRVDSIKSAAQLMNDIYMKSVGYGANLIINVPLDTEGRMEPKAAESLLIFGDAVRKLKAKDYALNASCTASNVRGGDTRQFGPQNLTDNDRETYWSTDDGVTTGEAVVQLDHPVTFDVVRLREQIRLGQRVKNFELDAWVDGKWVTIDEDWDLGKSIGYQVMRRVPTTTTDRVRLRITKSLACPCISEFSLLKTPDEYELTPEELNNLKGMTLLDYAIEYIQSHPTRSTAYGLGAFALVLAVGVAIYMLRRRKSKRQA